MIARFLTVRLAYRASFALMLSWVAGQRETISSAIDEARARAFVGRTVELADLDELFDPSRALRIAWIHGPGGVGKTELLAALSRKKRSEGWSVVTLDGAELSAGEADFAAQVSASLSEVTLPCLLTIDRFELISGLEPWFREIFWPSLPASVRVVIAGRGPPDQSSTTLGRWSLLLTIPLGSLDPLSVRAWLARTGTPKERWPEVERLTRGHPLALALFSEVVARAPEEALSLADHPEVVQILLQTLVDAVDQDWQRDALWAACVVRHLSEELLGVLLSKIEQGPSRVDVRQAFDWLHGLRFARADARGLTLHDLVRELLEADVRWRYPTAWTRLRAAAARHYRDQLRPGAATLGDVLIDFAYLWRDVVPHGAATVAGLSASGLRPQDRAELEAMIASFEGPESREIFSAWLDRGEAPVVVRDRGGRAQGMALYLWLDRLEPSAVAHDPGAARVLEWRRASGERGLVFRRFYLDRDAYQSPSASGLVLSGWEFMNLVCRPEVSDGITAWKDPAEGLKELPPGMLERCTEADFVVDGRTFAVLRTTAKGRDQFTWCVDCFFMPFLEGEAAPSVEHGLEGLSERQRQVATHVGLGLTNKEIAKALGTSAHTVRNQLVAIFERLGISTRAELAALVARTQRK